jgi:hypothetical protein
MNAQASPPHTPGGTVVDVVELVVDVTPVQWQSNAAGRPTAARSTVSASVAVTVPLSLTSHTQRWNAPGAGGGQGLFGVTLLSRIPRASVAVGPAADMLTGWPHSPSAANAGLAGATIDSDAAIRNMATGRRNPQVWNRTVRRRPGRPKAVHMARVLAARHEPAKDVGIMPLRGSMARQ